MMSIDVSRVRCITARVVVARMRIALIIAERIPAIVVTDVDNGDESGTPPTVIAVVGTTRTPGPTASVKDPASIVIWSPTPWFITNPCPAIRRTPHPATMAIWSPINVHVDGTRVW